MPANCADQFGNTGRYAIGVFTKDPPGSFRAPQTSYFFFEPNVYRDDGSWEVVDAEGHAAQPCNCSRDAADTASTASPRARTAAAPRGPIAFTFSLITPTRTLVHVIQGQARVSASSGASRIVRAGAGAELSGSQITAVTSWPASALGLVPAPERPPALTRLKHSKVRSGRLTVSFRLDGRAQVVVLLRRGRQRLTLRTVRGRRGMNVIVLIRRTWPHGRYQLILTATHDRRAGTQSLSFRR